MISLGRWTCAVTRNVILLYFTVIEKVIDLVGLVFAAYVLEEVTLRNQPSFAWWARVYLERFHGMPSTTRPCISK